MTTLTWKRDKELEREIKKTYGDQFRWKKNMEILLRR